MSREVRPEGERRMRTKLHNVQAFVSLVVAVVRRVSPLSPTGAILLRTNDERRAKVLLYRGYYGLLLESLLVVYTES